MWNAYEVEVGIFIFFIYFKTVFSLYVNNPIPNQELERYEYFEHVVSDDAFSTDKVNGFDITINSPSFFKSDLESPEYIGEFAFMYAKSSYNVHDNRILFICDFNYGIRVLDISDPSEPILVGDGFEFSYCNIVGRVGEDLMYVNGYDGNYFMILNISNINNIEKVGEVSFTTCSARNVFVSQTGDNRMYLGCSDGVEVFSLQDITNPASIHRIYGLGDIRSIYIEGDYAYLGGNAGFLTTVNISDIYHPEVIESFTENIFRKGSKVVVRGSIAYFADYFQKLMILNITEKNSTKILSEFKCDIEDFKIVGNIAYIAAGGEGMYILDISNSSKPIQLAQFRPILNDQLRYYHVILLNNTAIISNLQRGIVIVNVKNETNPVEEGYFCYGNEGMDIDFLDKYAFVADKYDGWKIFTVPNNKTISPKLIKSMDNGTLFKTVLQVEVVNMEYLFVRDYILGIYIYDVSNEEKILNIDQYHDFIPILYVSSFFVDLEHGFLHTTSYDGVKIFSAETGSFVLVGEYTDQLDSPKSVYAEGNYSYIADDVVGLIIINITDKTKPKLVSKFPTPYRAEKIIVKDGFAYIIDTKITNPRYSQILVVNITDKQYPNITQIVKIKAYSFAYDLKLVDNLIYVAWGNLVVLDISDPYWVKIKYEKKYYYNPGSIYLGYCNGIGVQKQTIGCVFHYNSPGLVFFHSDWRIWENRNDSNFFCGNKSVSLTVSDVNGSVDTSFLVLKPDICNGNNCTSFDTCQCYTSKYYGSFCNVTTCNGIFSNTTANISDSDSLCTGHGHCVGFDRCLCDVVPFEFWTGQFCEKPSCSNISSSDTLFVCTGHGNCVDYDKCECSPSSLYNGQFCQYYTCFDISNQNTTHVCNGRGTCVYHDLCLCYSGYSSSVDTSPCDQFYCGYYFFTDSKACNGRGTCVGSHECLCRDNYKGSNCENYVCNLIDHTRTSDVCSGNGDCIAPDQCNCKGLYYGDDCSGNLLYAIVLPPTISVSMFGLFFCLVGMCCIIFCICISGIIVFFASICCLGGVSIRQLIRLEKYGKLRNIDLLLTEQKMEDDVSVAHLRFNKKLFEIKFEEIKTIKILGEGGSNSIVFKAIWKGKECAFKCFKTRTLLSTQDKYDEFEREVEILSSLAHPSIIRFFGACLNPPRVGILMEFCSKGELLEFVIKFREKYENEYPVFEKIRLLTEVVSALEFLHSKNIIHRDLKCENVLIDESEHSKLMDFGLSRLVDSMSVAKTKKIGTNVYMAPEIVTSEKYNEKCDVFSFAIMTYVLFTENSLPYGSDDYQIEIKVANDPGLRPNMKELEEKMGDPVFDWIYRLIERCWDDNPENRPSCLELRENLEKKGSYKSLEEKNQPLERKKQVGKFRGVRKNSKFSEEEIELLVKKNLELEDEVKRLKELLRNGEVEDEI